MWVPSSHHAEHTLQALSPVAPEVSSCWGRATPTHMSPLPPALPQGAELLRDPSLGAQFRVHLVKMVILTKPEVGAKLKAQSLWNTRFCHRASGGWQGFPLARPGPGSQLCPHSALLSLSLPISNTGG